jgi:hypothetical protein
MKEMSLFKNFEFKWKYIPHIFFVAIACFLIAYLYSSLFENSWYQKGMVGFVIAIEITALWVFVLGKYYWVKGSKFYSKRKKRINWNKIKDRFKAVICFLIFII